MLSYSRLGSPAAELVLFVSQGTGSRRWSRIAARIERTSGYRRSLQQVLELGQQFQGTLDVSQRQSWLALEDALLEHTSQLNQAYFQAGVELGRRDLGRRAGHSRRARDPRVLGATERARERELISELARLIGKLVAR